MGSLENNNQIIRIDRNLLLDPTMCDAYMDGAYLCLTPNEFNILFCMAQKPGHAFSRQELFVAAFGHDDPKSHRVLDSHIKNIRKKLKEDARNARWLKGVHGYGYRLDFAPGFEPEVSVGEGGRVFRSAHGDRVLVVDSENRIVQFDGEELALTPIEYNVLNTLTARSSVEISNEELSQISLGVGFAESNRALASHVKNLRKKLGDEVKNPLWIKTVHGFGYRFLGVDETPAPCEEQMLDDSLIELSEQLQMAFDATSGSILLWHDVGGMYANVVEQLLLPDDVVLIREDAAGKFDTIRAINELGFDERALFYRSSPCVVDANDWFADVEASAESFIPEAHVEAIEAREVAADIDECGSVTAVAHDAATASAHSQPSIDEHIDGGTGSAAAAEPNHPELDEDWYLLSQFAELAGCSPDEALKLELFAYQTGFTLYADCACRGRGVSQTDFYLSLMRGAIVEHDSLPQSMLNCMSFKNMVYRAIRSGDLLDYDESSWITRDGLDELDIRDVDLRSFALDAIERGADDDAPYFTVPWLRRCASDLPLLEYGLSDAFYESALLSQEDLLGHGNLVGIKLFAPRGHPMKGRDFIQALVAREISIDIDDLVDLLSEEYGVVVPRAQLIQIIRKSDLFYSSASERVFVSHDQFVLEVE